MTESLRSLPLLLSLGWNPRLRTLLKFSNKANGGVNTLFFALHPFRAAAWNQSIAIPKNNLSKGGSFLLPIDQQTSFLEIKAVYLVKIIYAVSTLFIMFIPYQNSNVSLEPNKWSEWQKLCTIQWKSSIKACIYLQNLKSKEVFWTTICRNTCTENQNGKKKVIPGL